MPLGMLDEVEVFIGQLGGKVGSRNDTDSSPSCAHSARARGRSGRAAHSRSRGDVTRGIDFELKRSCLLVFVCHMNNIYVPHTWNQSACCM